MMKTLTARPLTGKAVTGFHITMPLTDVLTDKFFRDPKIGSYGSRYKPTKSVDARPLVVSIAEERIWSAYLEH